MNNFTEQQITAALAYIYINHPKEDRIGHLCHLDKKDFLKQTGFSVSEAKMFLSELQSKGLLLLKSESSMSFDFVPFEELYDFIYSGGF